ncbi:MAG: hypothetical protein C0402_06885 [Thermodesulfovibrio sp.]|nr:hypothetical protein [Thermodesulfovibrio sp.]
MAILTISREFGSGGREIGLATAQKLHYAYIDKEQLMVDMRADGSEWVEWGKTFDEHRPTIWEKYDWSFRGFGALLQSHILDHALSNNTVIMGRGGNFLLQDIPHALSIRVKAPLDQRIERIMVREAVDKDTARWLCEKTDKERSGQIYLLYGRHWDDPAAYDMVFDTGVRTLEEITALIISTLSEKEKAHTEAAEKLLNTKAVAARIKSEILTDHALFVPVLDVFLEGDQLILRGVTHSPQEHKKIEEKAKRIAGDIPLKCELHYRG